MKCFACGKSLNWDNHATVDTRDDQFVSVGPECFRKIKVAGEQGYQPPLGGPRLWLWKGYPTS
jgi:hypothetical protein